MMTNRPFLKKIINIPNIKKQFLYSWYIYQLQIYDYAICTVMSPLK
jgi:hypothetical protein